jgi:hypothetical protein
VRNKGADGATTIEYTTIWSNEDGGTNTPALMARWGRTTDIEWIYRLVLGDRGRILREAYQGPNHETKQFTGAKLGRHPLLVNVRLNRGFLLDDAFLPQPSFLRWAGDAALTPASPEAVIWRAA